MEDTPRPPSANRPKGDAAEWGMNRMEKRDFISARIKHSLEEIASNSMAISGISHLIYDLKIDSDWRGEEGDGKYPALARFADGLYDCALARALEVMAEDINERCDVIEECLKDES